MVLLAPPPTAADINANATAPPALLPLERFAQTQFDLRYKKKHAKVARNDKLISTIQRLPLVGRTVRVRLKYR